MLSDTDSTTEHIDKSKLGMDDPDLASVIIPAQLTINPAPSPLLSPLILLGAAQQVRPDDNPIPVETDEAVEIDRREGEPADGLDRLPSPVNIYMNWNSPFQFALATQLVGPSGDTSDDDVSLVHRQLLPDTVQTQDRPDPTDAAIVHVLAVDPVVIDLTDDADDEVQPANTTSPLTIDLTQEIDEVPSPPVIDLTQDDDEQAPDADSASQAADQQRSVNGITDPHSQPIDTTIQSPTQTKKRASSTDDAHLKREHKAKRLRNSAT